MIQQPIRIIGAGLGGLALGRCLLRHGIPAILYERVPSGPRHNYGITLHSSSYQPLLKVLDMDELTFKRRVAVDGTTGGTGKINTETSSFRANRAKLESLLSEGLSIQWDHTLSNVEKSGSGSMVLSFRDRPSLNSTITIGADGPHSTTRESLLPRNSLKVLPFVAINGKRHVSRTLFEQLYAPTMKDSTVVELKRDDVVLHVSVNSESAENETVSVSWIYSRPSRGENDPLFRANRSLSNAKDIPEEFFTEVKTFQSIKQPFKEVFREEKLIKDRLLLWLMRTNLVTLAELQEVGKKGVFFIGDSVHAQPILGGDGANAAIVDAVGLAECISQDVSLDNISSWYESQYPRWVDGLDKSQRSISMMHM